LGGTKALGGTEEAAKVTKDCSRTPHFLWCSVALMYLTRLSLMKAAHVDDGLSRVQEIRAIHRANGIDMPLLREAGSAETSAVCGVEGPDAGNSILRQPGIIDNHLPWPAAVKLLDHTGNTLYDEDVAPALQLPTLPSG
jgi:hypothetical protein